MDLGKVNQKGMMEMLINLLSSCSNIVFNPMAYNLFGSFLRNDCQWQPEKFNHGLVRQLLWETNTTLASGTENMPRRAGKSHYEFLWHVPILVQGF